MPKPLVSQDPNPRDIQFTHFGVLNTGGQSKSSLFTSITVNVILALVIVIIGAAGRKAIHDQRVKEAIYPVAIKEKPPEPPKPPPVKIIPPKPIPKPLVEPPKIKLPDVKIPDPPKPIEVKVLPPKPVPVITPAPPKAVVAAAAPKPVAVNLGQSASVVNHDTHPAPVALGQATNPIAPSNRPATAAVNLGQRGLAGMPSTNTGGGPPSTRVNLGSGQPNGGLNGTGARAVQGVNLGGVTNGTPGGRGNGNTTQPQQVALGHPPPPPPTPGITPAKAVGHPPQVTYKPKPVYTADATQNHIEGQIQVRIRVSATGQVTVIGISGSGLGHGLDQSALAAAAGIRFRPATDASGNPIDWEGPVTITFQLA